MYVLDFAEHLPCAKIRYHIDSDSIVYTISVSCEQITNKVAETEFVYLSDFIRQNQFVRQKETYTNDFENEIRFANGLCTVEFMKYTSPLREIFGKNDRFGLRIVICSRIIIYHIPEEIKMACIRLTVPQKQPEAINKSFYCKIQPTINWISEKRYVLFFFIGIIALLLSFVFLIKCSGKENTNHSMLYEEATKDGNKSYVVYICTGSSSKKYHWVEDCEWLQNCSGRIEPLTIENAEELGRTPCKSCCK